MRFVLIALLLTACSSKQQKCELARDAALVQGERLTKRALASIAEGDRAEMQRRADAELDAMRKNFVTRCIEADEATRACVVRIPEIVQVDDKVKAAQEACPLPEDLIGGSTCRKKLQQQRDAAIGMCDDLLKPFFASVYGELPPH